MALPQHIPFLNWTWDDLLFLILAGIVLGAAIFVVAARDIIRSGLAMILSFAALAGIYALLGAVLVAAAQVLIYIGAISVLILFAIMLTETKSGPANLVFHRQAWAGALAAIGIAVLVMVAIIGTPWPGKQAERVPYETEAVAMLLFADPLYVLSLQVVGVLLTAAVIGGVFLAKRESTADPGARPSTLERLQRPVVPPAPIGGPAASGRTAAAGDRRGASATDGRNLAGSQEPPASRAAGAGAGGGIPS
jgi:NADH:ubiquinone oxidoreductase subunit 6 (subunit J)